MKKPEWIFSMCRWFNPSNRLLCVIHQGLSDEKGGPFYYWEVGHLLSTPRKGQSKTLQGAKRVATRAAKEISNGD